MIRILSAVFGLLYANPDIELVIQDKIFPNIVPDKDDKGETIKYPLIVINRAGLVPTYTKGIDCSADNATVEVICYGESYFQTLDLAQSVRETLEFVKGTVSGIKIDNARFSTIDEGFSQNVYFQRLVFTFK